MEIKMGWAQTSPRRKNHYFVADMALCGCDSGFALEVSSAMPDEGRACKRCLARLEKRKRNSRGIESNEEDG